MNPFRLLGASDTLNIHGRACTNPRCPVGRLIQVEYNYAVESGKLLVSVPFKRTGRSGKNSCNRLISGSLLLVFSLHLMLTVGIYTQWEPMVAFLVRVKQVANKYSVATHAAQ